ncbi:MAG: helix-turn-helix domain-containing protein [Candidatus Falkowbacteria bacterium]
MKNKDLKKVLIDLGLSENEAQVYLSALSLGPSSITKIAGEANMKRTTVHSLIDPLKNLGLMRIDMKGWKKQYVAESPEQLDKILERKRQRFKETLPDFMSLFREDAKDSVIRYYEGLEAIKNIYTEFSQKMSLRDEILVVGDTKKTLDLDEVFFTKIFEREAKMGVKKRLLLTQSEEAGKYKQIQSAMGMNIKILPATTQLSTVLRIVPDRIFIHLVGTPIMALTIENKHIIKMFREFFELMWASLPQNK